MKNYFKLLFALTITSLTLSACGNEDLEKIKQTDLLNEYTLHWLKTFGLIDSNQDWCTVAEIEAEITMPHGATAVSVYNANPAEGGHLIGRTAHSGTMMLDMPKGAESIYARFTDKGGRLVKQGFFEVVDGRAYINAESIRMQKSRAEGEAIKYAHTPSYFDAMIICEDLGSIGDFDFNDIVLGLKHESGDDPKLIIVPMAAGATLASEIYFDGHLLGETHDLLSPGADPSQMLNTMTKSIGSVSKLASIEIKLDDPKYENWTIAKNWGDITLKVIGQESTVKITKPTEGSAPQLICLGGDWFWPRESVNINDAYLGFGDWSCDANALTWLGDWEDSEVVKWDVPATNPDQPEDDTMWFKAKTSDGKPYYVHLNGSATATEIESGEVYVVNEPLTSCENMFAVYSTSQALILNSDGNYVLGYPTIDSRITKIEFSDNFDMSAVTSFAHMFDGCRSLTSVNVDSWTAPTAVLTDMTAMWHHCESLTTLDLSGWTVDNVTGYFDIFGYCTSLTSLNLDGWTIKSGANLRRFLGDTKNMTVKCSESVENKLTADSTVGGTNITFTRP